MILLAWSFIYDGKFLAEYFKSSFGECNLLLLAYFLMGT